MPTQIYIEISEGLDFAAVRASCENKVFIFDCFDSILQQTPEVELVSEDANRILYRYSNTDKANCNIEVGVYGTVCAFSISGSDALKKVTLMSKTLEVKAEQQGFITNIRRVYLK